MIKSKREQNPHTLTLHCFVYKADDIVSKIIHLSRSIILLNRNNKGYGYLVFLSFRLSIRVDIAKRNTTWESPASSMDATKYTEENI